MGSSLAPVAPGAVPHHQARFYRATGSDRFSRTHPILIRALVMAIGVLIAVGRSWGGKDRDTGSVVTSALI